MLQELCAGSCSALCCSLSRGTTGQGGTSGLLCLGVGLPVLSNEEGLERLCRTDRMGFGACVEKLRDLLLKRRPRAHPATTPGVVSVNPGIVKVGKILGDDQV